MKFIEKILLIALLFASEIALAQIPDGAISLIKETGINYQKSSSKGTLSSISISEQPFTTGFRFTTGSDIANTWDAQVSFTKIAGIELNDVVLITFYARTISSIQESGDGSIIGCIEENKDPYGKQVYQKVAIGHDWKQYYIPLKCKSTLAVSGLTYSFHIGFISQTIEVADVKFLNYKKTIGIDELPETEVTYYGREVDAPWRAEAAERINQIRKGNADFVVYDESGQLLPDAAVSVEMQRHKFGFGSAVDSRKFLSDIVYRKKIYELFNEVVLENDLKWPSFTSSKLYSGRTLDSLRKRQIDVRGHNVVWPSFKYNSTALKTLSADPVAFRNEIDRHIDEVTQYAKGRVIDWDVLNEPYTNKEFMNILGNEVMADWFKRVRQNDKQVKLYINDYSILSAGGMDINHQNGYYDIINYIDGLGGKIEGIGLQSHFGTDLTPITKVYSILDRFAGLGKELKITEHDINLNQPVVQADYTRDFMTITFSHPAVKSFLFWGFWAGVHWLPEGALYNLDWTIRPHGEAYLDLVFNQWWTKKTDLITDSDGKTSIDGFLGTYKYTIKSGGKERSGTFKIDNSKAGGLQNQIILSFNEDIPDNFSIAATPSANICEGENVTLQTNGKAELEYKWYRGEVLLPKNSSAIIVNQPGIYVAKLTLGEIEIASPSVEVTVTAFPEAKITTTGDLSFCAGEKVTLSTNSSSELTYNWYKGATKIQGSVTSIDISSSGTYSLATNSLGCLSMSEPVVVNALSVGDPACTTGINDQSEKVQVYPNPFKGEFTLETQSNLLTTVELFNEVGSKIFTEDLTNSNHKMNISVSVPGFYTLRIINPKEIQTFKLLAQ
jgi:GH35 family endo-1,4-beta-xylanase